MLITTALHHNEYAFKGIVAVPEAVAVIKSTEEQEPLKSSDLAAQSADVAGIDLASCWLWTMWLPDSNGHDATMELAWSCNVGTDALHANRSLSKTALVGCAAGIQ